MMSKQWTFSLLTLILVGLLIAAPAALANKVTIRIHDANGADDTTDAISTANTAGDPTDVSSEDGIQVFIGSPSAAVASLRLDFEEPIVVPMNAAGDAIDLGGIFEIIGDSITTSADTIIPSEGNKRLVVPLATTPAAGTEVTIFLIPGKFTSATTGAKDSSGAMLKFKYVAADQGIPMPLMMKRLPPASGFMAAKVSGPFDVKITLSEKPKEFKAAHIGVQNGSVGAVVDGGTIEEGTAEQATAGTHIAPDTATGRDSNGYIYKVTITPDFKKDKVIVWVKDFEDQALNPTNKYVHNVTVSGTTATTRKIPDDLTNGTTKLDVSVDLTGVAKSTAAPGMSVSIPDDTIIPAGGYLVVVRDDGDGANEAEKSSESQIIHPGDRKNMDLAVSGRSIVKQLYNVVPVDLKYNLEGFLIRGGTIDLISPDAGVMISEIMWGTDGGDTNRQWIEIHNTGSTQLKTKGYKLMLYTANEALPDKMDATLKIIDRASTLYKGTNHWSIVGKGQSGNTQRIIERRIEGIEQDVDIAIATVETGVLISMERVMDAAGMYADGTMNTSWAQSVPPSSNFVDAAGGLFVGSPGAAPINPVADPVPAPDPEPAAVIPVAMASDIVITEIMVDTGNNRLPQWIELTNVSGAEKRLDGWSIQITNSEDDTTPVGSSINIDLSGTLGVGGGADMGGTMGKTLLLVAWSGRKSSNLEGNERIVDVSSDVDQRGRYKLISDMAFMIALIPPQTTGILTYGDTVGNLDADPAWDLPMSMNGRSSLIRKMDAGVSMMGDAAASWVLASGTGLIQTAATWYGSDEDAGTPGVVGGGPLPVELSHFRPARDKATGAVVITWATQSELNNAGFFIKRSNQRDGEFKVINAAMVPGAGTTSEKQFYTYTDTTAQPNVVYYYQIEDVSLDGNRQTLTRGIRLKGHVGAAGKATVIWGELKASHE